MVQHKKFTERLGPGQMNTANVNEQHITFDHPCSTLLSAVHCRVVKQINILSIFRLSRAPAMRYIEFETLVSNSTTTTTTKNNNNNN